MMISTNVNFVFNGEMYCQVDGLAMGSPLSGSFADIFVGFHEQHILHRIKPKMYVRYADDVYIISNDESESVALFEELNHMHPNLLFLQDNGDTFLDVRVVQTGNQLLTRIHRKKTFTGLYTHFSSFCPKRYKMNLVRTLFYRVRRICSQQFLSEEEAILEEILIKNGYPLWFIRKFSTETSRPITVEKKQVYLRLPYYGQKSTQVSRTIARAVEKCYYHIRLCIIYKTTQLSANAPKDVIPLSYRNNIVYQYLCGCGASYIGKCARTLKLRIK